MSATMTPAVRGDDGRGPGGMWWVAWRLHRRLVIGWLLGAGLASALLFWVRRAFESAEATKSCPDGVPSCPNAVLMAFYENLTVWQLLFWALVVAPALAGLAGGVALFAADFDRGTQVFVLSQSVSRVRWFGVGLVVVGVPVVFGAAVLGSALDGVQGLILGFSAGWYDPFLFSAAGTMAAAVCVLGFAIGILSGLLLRNPLPAALLGVAATAIVAGIVLAQRPHLIEPVRVVTPISANQYDQVPMDSWTTGGGFVDSRGTEVGDLVCADANGPLSWDACLTANDISAYWIEFVPLDQRPRLQANVAAVYAAIAAVLIAAGAVVLRRRRAV